MNSNKYTTELYVWGADHQGQLGLGRKTDKQFLTVPKTCSFNIQLSQVACGEDFTFMLTTQGLVYGMGSNQYGKLGFAVSKQEKDQVTPKLVDALSQHQIKQISCGLNHALAVTAESGVVYSWGCGNQGQLGRQISQLAGAPQAIMSFVSERVKIKQVSAGGKHSLYLSEQGNVYSSGSNDYGQLGYPEKTFQHPQLVENLPGNCVQVACGLTHSQVLTAGGQVFSFGDNQFGQLGIGQQPQQSAQPRRVDIAGIRKISCNHHTAAINEVGALFFWGTGVFGTFYEPRIVVDADIDSVSVGGSFGIARDKDGLLWSWGQDSYGALGHQDGQSKLYPHPILSLKRKVVTEIVCGGSFAIAIGQDKLLSGNPKRKKSTGSRQNSQRRTCSKENIDSQMLSQRGSTVVKTHDNTDIGMMSGATAEQLRTAQSPESPHNIFNISVPLNHPVSQPTKKQKQKKRKLTKSSDFTVHSSKTSSVQTPSALQLVNLKLKHDLSQTKLALRTTKDSKFQNQQLLDHLQQAVGRCQELEYLVNSKEQKIVQLSLQVSELLQILAQKDEQLHQMNKVLDQYKQDNTAVLRQNENLRHENCQVGEQIRGLFEEIRTIKEQQQCQDASTVVQPKSFVSESSETAEHVAKSIAMLQPHQPAPQLLPLLQLQTEQRQASLSPQSYTRKQQPSSENLPSTATVKHQRGVSYSSEQPTKMRIKKLAKKSASKSATSQKSRSRSAQKSSKVKPSRKTVQSQKSSQPRRQRSASQSKRSHSCVCKQQSHKSKHSRRGSAAQSVKSRRSILSQKSTKSAREPRIIKSIGKVTQHPCLDTKQQQLFDLQISQSHHQPRRNQRQTSRESDTIAILQVQQNCSSGKKPQSSPSLGRRNAQVVSFSQKSATIADSPQKHRSASKSAKKSTPRKNRSASKSAKQSSVTNDSPIRSCDSRSRLARAAQLLQKSQQANPYKRRVLPGTEMVKSASCVIQPQQQRESISSFRQKLSRLERNKLALEDKVKRYERDIRSQVSD